MAGTAAGMRDITGRSPVPWLAHGAGVL